MRTYRPAKIIGRDQIGSYLVSTIAADGVVSHAPQTCVFLLGRQHVRANHSSASSVVESYATDEAALAGHQKYVSMVQDGLGPELLDRRG